jgi:phospholipid/cholesterol/gamma-HCH transport system permease protein
MAIGAAISGLGEAALGMLFEVGRQGQFCFKVLQIALLRNRTHSMFKQVVGQILFTGVEAFALVSAVGLIAGITIVIQAMENMPRMGVGEYFGSILILAVVRELGPVFVALVVIGRSGSALATFIGSMSVNRETAALEVMGIDPVQYLAVPALWGMILSIVCLNIYFDLVAIGGGIIGARAVGVAAEIPFGIFMGRVLEALTTADILLSTIKGLLFGIVITTVSCYHGLQVKTVRQLPVASIRSVVNALVYTIAINVLVTVVYYVWIARG